VIRDEIRDNMQVLFMRCLYQVFDVFHGSKMRINLVEICDMVSMVRRGFVKWRNPQCCDTKVSQIGEFTDYTSDGSPYKNWLVPVLGGVKSCEPIDEDMINDTIFKPAYTTHQGRMHYHLL